jgi:hypothetical protein
MAYDCTGKIGPFERVYQPVEWAMYSYERPAYMLWNAIASELHANGWSDGQIKNWLQSKGPRYELDGALGEAITELGKQYATAIRRGYCPGTFKEDA